MTINKGLPIVLVLICLFVLSAGMNTVFSQPSSISGTAPGWAGKEIRLLIENDPISKTYREVDSDSIAMDGSFNLSVDTNESALYWLAVQRFKSPIWISPGSVYPISTIEIPENILVDTWQNGSFQYAFLSLDSTDINKVLADFDTEYYNFYLDNAQFIGTSHLKRKVFDYTNNLKLDSSRALIYNYKNYTLAEMKLSAGFKKVDIYNEYLKNKPFALHNTAWFHFFDLFYSDYFQTYDLKFGGATIANRLKTGLPADSLSILLSQDDFLQNDTIRQLVILKSIAEVYTNTTYPRAKLVDIVNLAVSNPETPQLGGIAERLKNKMRNTLIGSSLNIIAKNWEPEYISSPDTLPTVVMVSTDRSTATEKEALVLKHLFEKYGSIAHFAEVKIGEETNSAGRPWDVYSPKDKMQFLDHFKIYGFPHFIWIDGDGIIRENAIEKPSEGLESRLFKILTEKENKNRIKVGQ